VFVTRCSSRREGERKKEDEDKAVESPRVGGDRLVRHDCEMQVPMEVDERWSLSQVP
jgi:hypothetical protein